MPAIARAAVSACLFLLPLLAGCAGQEAISTAPPAGAVVFDPVDALVMVGNSVPEGLREGYGVVIGDGTLVVTAYHVAFEASECGVHTSPGNLSVTSPYLGEISSCRVIGANRELDVAVLEMPWRGHPSVALAPAEEIFVAREARFVSYNWPGQDGAKWQDIRGETLPVYSVIAIHGVPALIETRGYGKLGRGWSGCPILSADGRRLLGCFTAIQNVGGAADLLRDANPDHELPPQYFEKAHGPAAGVVLGLIAKAGRTDSLAVPRRFLPRPADARQAIAALMKASASARPAITDVAVRDMEAYLAIRQNSAEGTRLLAGRQLFTKSYNQLAEETFRRAIALSSADPEALLGYGQCLELSGRNDEALAQFSKAGDLAPDDSRVDVQIIQLLINAKRYDEALSKANSAIDRYGDNAYLFLLRGVLYQMAGKNADAVADMEKATDMYPENVAFKVYAIKLFEKLNLPNRAENQCRVAVKVAGDNPKSFVLLARFLAAHKPEDRAEILDNARTALGMPDIQGPDREEMQKLVDSLQEPPAKPN